MIGSRINNLAKISIIGYPAVGKTSLLKLLSQKLIDRIYLPTQGFDLKTVEFENYRIKIWDFGGQNIYMNSFLSSYLLGSDIVLVVTDSTLRNVMSSRVLIDVADKILDDECPIIAIANKQDLYEQRKDRLEVNKIEEILEVQTYGMIAIDPSHKLRLIKIIKNELNKVLSRKEVVIN
ncbi:MAG: GTP-binding protein [Candidatus Lokiarchaeota archaeon]|nr:GTP-binding protein [Candidatus Lokiarchaeota archaeon]